MKKIMSGKLYDTELANKVVIADNGYEPNEPEYYQEILYKTNKGSYFLYAHGGIASKYAAHVGEKAVPGQTMIAMTEVKAKEWALKYLDVDTFLLVFRDTEIA